METKTKADSFAATNLEPEADTCVHCGQTKADHSPLARACVKAGYYGNHFAPETVTPAEIVPDHEVRWGVRWPSLHPAPEGHTDRWYDSEDEARDVFRTTRGDANLIRKVVINCPAEVIEL